jgi:hypothetical protein
MNLHPIRPRIQLPHPVLADPYQRRRGAGLAGLGFHVGLGVVQVLDPSQTQTIASTIQQVEGYYPGSLAYQNNNPGNLVYVGQAGATPGAGGFAKFGSYDDGLQALDNQIQLYAARGMTISQMMNTYAPASAGNNPTAYANQIAGALGVDPNTSLLDLAGFNTSSAAPLPSLPDVTTSWLPDLSGAASWLPDFSTIDPASVGMIAAGLIAGIFILNTISD